MLPWARETIELSARFCLCIKIFRRILTENAQQYVASGEGFFGDRIGDARHLNENLEKNLQIESVYYKKLGKNLEGIGYIRIFANAIIIRNLFI